MRRMKLFLVTLRGFGGYSPAVDYHSSYVIAPNCDDAYLTVRQWLDKKDYGFKMERELDNIKLIADEYEFTDVKTRLFISEGYIP
jgi:hypothetical protein